MYANCSKCNIAFSSDVFMRCEVCQSAFHTNCANIVETDLILIKNNKNIFWKCDVCCKNSLYRSMSKIIDLYNFFKENCGEFDEIYFSRINAIDNDDRRVTRSQNRGKCNELIGKNSSPALNRINSPLPSTSNNAKCSPLALRSNKNVNKKSALTVGKHPSSSSPSSSSSSAVTTATSSASNTNSGKQSKKITKGLYGNNTTAVTCTAATVLQCSLLQPAGTDEIDKVSPDISNNASLQSAAAVSTAVINKNTCVAATTIMKSNVDVADSDYASIVSPAAVAGSSASESNTAAIIISSETDAAVIPNYAPDNVNRLNSNRGSINRSNVIAGISEQCVGFKVVRKLRWYHISSFHPNTSPDDICTYIASKLRAVSSLFSCFKLVKHNGSAHNIKYLNFKIGIPTEYANIVFSADFWPVGVNIRSFAYVPKNDVAQNDVQII